MHCTRHVMGIPLTHHTWKVHVRSSEVLETQETNMWARPVFRAYVRCDKQEVCEVCGAEGRVTSCICDMARGERCEPRVAWLAETQARG